jgi:hypothetical protein
MKKLLSSFLIVVFLTAATRPAFAQEPPPPQEVIPQGAPHAVIPQGAPSIVRANFRAGKLQATIYDRNTGRMVCATPCTADIPVGNPLRVVLAGGEEEPHDFVVTGENGPQVDVEIKRGGKGALAGGIVMISIGGAAAVVGLVFLLVSAAVEDSSIFRDEAEDYRLAGIVTLVAGLGLTAGGIVLLGSRSYEASTRQKETPAYGSRSELFRADKAAGSRDPMMLPAAQQLGWTFAF